MPPGVAQIRITGNTTEAIAALERLGIKAEETGKKTEGAFSGSSGKSFANFGKLAAAGMAGAGIVAIKMAGDFQESMTQLVTGAGEAQANIKQVSDGILAMAPKVGETTKQLASGMYMVSSAGFHGAEGLKVLQAAAEGARVGNADLGTVADAVTSALNSYHLKGVAATATTTALVQAVASGKMHMQDLAGSLGAILPAASKAHVSLDEVLGAISTMTAQGTPAADAATYLRQTILQLSNPSAKAATEMKALGLSSIDVSNRLGERGLQGTLTLLTTAIENKMGPAGTVLVEQLKKSAKSTTDFQKILANLPPVQQTYIGALANMVGGTKSMQAALELTGTSSQTFADNTTAIITAASAAGDHVQGWAEVQKDFNFKLDQAKASLGVLAIQIGTKLIPVVEGAAKVISSVIGWLQKNKEIALALGIVVGGVLVTAMGLWIVSLFAAGGALEFMLGPIGLIIAAVALLVLGAMELYKHWGSIWHGITEAVSTAFHWVTHIIGDAIGWIGDHWGLVLSLFIGPVGLGIQWIVDHWSQVTHFFGQSVHLIGQIFTSIGKGVANGFIWGINQIIGAWDSLVGMLKIPGFDTGIPGVPKFGGIDLGKGLQISQIPYLAAGGIVTGPTLAMLGEGINDEAVIPLPRGGAAGLGGGPTEIHVHLEGPVAGDWTAIGQKVAGAVRDQLLRSGRNLPNVGLA